MVRNIFLTWIILGIQVAAAQEKDTLRENIDYRWNYSFPDLKKQTNSGNTQRLGRSRNTFDFSNKQKDTIREAVDYRRNYSFQRSYRFRPSPAFSHYLGFQINSFFHEISQPDSSYIRNPFVLTYSINHRRRGYGLGIGYGYTDWGNEVKNSSNNIVASANSRMNFRISVDKKKLFGKRLNVGIGADVLFVQFKELQKTFIDGFVDEMSSQTSGWGVGPRVSIYFKLNRWICLGTETSYYFKRLKTESQKKFTGLPPEYKSGFNEKTSAYLAPLSLFVMAKIN